MEAGRKSESVHRSSTQTSPTTGRWFCLCQTSFRAVQVLTTRASSAYFLSIRPQQEAPKPPTICHQLAPPDVSLAPNPQYVVPRCEEGDPGV